MNDVNQDLPPAEEGAGNLTNEDILDGSYTHPIQPTPTPTEPTPTPTPTVQLSCTSITGETAVVAQYDSVPCPADDADEPMEIDPDFLDGDFTLRDDPNER